MTAISRTTTTTDFRTISPDTDLAERAAAGEQDAFEELYRRHVQPAWRFAQAVSPNRDSACEAADEAFVRVLRVVRRGRAAAAQNFRAYLLAAVYRNALEALRANGRPEDSSEAASPDASDDELLGVAFRSLPERWRAALWLTDVEHIAVQDVAPILGVSTAVTGQMVTRARTGLTNRFQQAGRANDLPDVPATLRAGALALPTGLAEATLARWKRAMAAERRRVIPAAGWLTDRAPRPLAAWRLRRFDAQRARGRAIRQPPVHPAFGVAQPDRVRFVPRRLGSRRVGRRSQWLHPAYLGRGRRRRRRWVRQLDRPWPNAWQHDPRWDSRW
jgi:RNA polymerase sigma factor (sigma-70 family)